MTVLDTIALALQPVAALLPMGLWATLLAGLLILLVWTILRRRRISRKLPRDSAAPIDRQQAPDRSPEGLLQRLQGGLSKTRHLLGTDIERLFSQGRRLDDQRLETLEELLITADIGVQTTLEIMQRISRNAPNLTNADQLKQALKNEVLRMLESTAARQPVSAHPQVVMIIGVNGVGKTTTIGKLAAAEQALGRKALIGAADTFRAAAVEQLTIWAQRAGADIVAHKNRSDPASVAFDAVTAAKSRGADVVYIDTAGRLHTKVNLMAELKKIKRALAKAMPNAPHETLLVLDATTGQNAISQAKMFNQGLGVDAIALTKLDGTAKGGIAVAISHSLDIPLKYIGVGEQIGDLQPFDASRFVEALFA